jgi:hypothetical protein
MMFSRQCLRLARHQKIPLARLAPPATSCLAHRSLSSDLGGLPSQFEMHPRTKQLIDDIDTTVLAFGHGQDYSKDQDVEVTGNAMTLDSLIKLGTTDDIHTKIIV